VFVPDGLLPADPEPGHDLAEAELEARLHEEIAELKHTLGRAEGRAETLLQQVSSLAENLAAERARGDRLEAALAEARKGWLERLLEAIRKR
jgi:hypothetical protein